MKRIDDLEECPIIGEWYLVPCVISTFSNGKMICPVYNPPHSDKSSHQYYKHYHLDCRFFDRSNINHIFNGQTRIEVKDDTILEYVALQCVDLSERIITPVSDLVNAKLPNKCKNNDICPHKGFNLKTIPFEDNVRTCPLHGLKIHRDGSILNKP